MPGSNIIVPSSNFIRHVKNDPFFQRFIDFLNQTDCPITFCGLGAQSSKVFNTPKKLVNNALNPVQIRFFKMISERAVSLGVRGEFTAECLELMGIHNYRIIGCPSLFQYLDGVFPEIKAPRSDSVQITITPGTYLKSKVMELGMKNGCTWVIQSYSEYPQMKKVCGQELVSPKWLYKNFPGSFKKSNDIVQYSKNHSKVFFDIETWNQFYEEERITFAFGTRFHGNMEALRNGIPALWIVHDSRTRELTNFLGLPYIEIDKIPAIKTIEELYTYCDYSETQKKYNRLCANYVQYLEENHIEHEFKLAVDSGKRGRFLTP